VGAPAPPPGGEKKFFRPNLQEKCESAPPQNTKCTSQPEQESIFRTVFACCLRFGGIFRQSLRATTKKSSSTFFRKKVHPPVTPADKNPGYAYEWSKH